MADKVLKYRVGDYGAVRLPKGGRIVHAWEEQAEHPPTLLVIADPLAEKEVRYIKTVAVGWAVSPHDVYITTFHSHHGPVLVFEDKEHDR